MLSGVSADYITRLEQGRATTPSPQVLAALARALRLSSAERHHLFLLAGQPLTAGHMPTHLTPGVQRLLDQLDGTPVAVYDAAWTLLAWNHLWGALLGDPSMLRGRDRNVLWRHFTGERGRISHTAEGNATFEASAVGRPQVGDRTLSR